MAVWGLTHDKKIIRIPKYLLESKHFNSALYFTTRPATEEGLKELQKIRNTGVEITNGFVRTCRTGSNSARDAYQRL